MTNKQQTGPVREESMRSNMPPPEDQPMDEVLDDLENWADIINEIHEIDSIIDQMEDSS